MIFSNQIIIKALIHYTLQKINFKAIYEKYLEVNTSLVQFY